MLSEMHEATYYCWKDNYSKGQKQWDVLKTWNQKETNQDDTQNKGKTLQYKNRLLPLQNKSCHEDNV